MRIGTVLALAGCAVMLAGCLVTSVYPFYRAKDVTFEPALAGSWTNVSEAQEQWQFAAVNTNSYRLTYVTKDATNVMDATLFRLQGRLFLDLFSSEMNEQAPPPVPSHFLFRMIQIKPTVKMAPMDYEW